MDDFERELKMGFLVEAGQVLSDVEESYLQLERDPHDGRIIDSIFRAAHNIKGSSKAVGFDDVGAFAHEFENLLLKIKMGEVKPTPSLVSLLLDCNDALLSMINALKDDFSAKVDISHLLPLIAQASCGALGDSENLVGVDQSYDENVPTRDDFISAVDTNDAPAPQENDSESSDVSTQALTIVEARKASTANQNTEVAKEAGGSRSGATVAASSHGADETIRVSLNRLEKLINYVGEIVVMQAVLKEQTSDLDIGARKTIDQLGKVIKEVHYISMGLRMVPLKQTFQKMQRIVRDTSKALNKNVELVMLGDETEVDKTILESLSDPLVHLVRNACDHGIETAEKRIAAGKEESGQVTLSAYHRSGKLVVEVLDDGGGINPEILKQKAKEKGILRGNEHLSDSEIIQLIFHPGFSTKAAVTDVSGRGVGMDVVKTNIEAIQGKVEVETNVGIGSTFRIILPLTLSIIDALVVKSGQSKYVIPLSHVQESVRVTAGSIKPATGLGEILLLRGENIPLYRLSRLLKNTTKNTSESIAIVITSGPSRFSILVEDILGQSQVVIKKLGEEVQGIRGFAGSAILGDGRPALILELSDLIHTTKRTQTTSKARTGGVAA